MIQLQYTDEQIIAIKDNLKYLATDAMQILNFISEEKDVLHNDIPKKLDKSKYVVDKCIAAFLVSGLIKRREEGNKKLYSLTNEGKKILELREEI